MKNDQNIQYQPIKLVYFNPGSRQHCLKWLSDLNYKPVHFSAKGNPVFNAEVMSMSDIPETKLLAEYFKLSKDYGQLYMGKKSILKKTIDGVIRHRCQTLGTNTGRMAHSDPNLGQVPAIKEFRELFKAPKGFKIVGADMDAQELRIFADLLYPYDNGIYANAVLSGKKEDKTDIHSLNQKVANLKTRDEAKTMIYAILYGASAIKIGYSIAPEGFRLNDITPSELEIVKHRKIAHRAKLIDNKPYFPISENIYIPITEDLIHRGIHGLRIMKLFENKTIGYMDLKNKLMKEAESGYIKGIDGRFLPVRSAHSALNLRCQGTAATITKIWIGETYRLVRKNKMKFGRDFRPLAIIHDEQQAAVREEIADEFGNCFVEAAMTINKIIPLNIPMAASYKIGDTWYDTH
jgi:DNA polymerase I-like protein with 3'-5' exonuclease and polymerase domains